MGGLLDMPERKEVAAACVAALPETGKYFHTIKYGI